MYNLSVAYCDCPTYRFISSTAAQQSTRWIPADTPHFVLVAWQTPIIFSLMMLLTTELANVYAYWMAQVVSTCMQTLL